MRATAAVGVASPAAAVRTARPAEVAVAVDTPAAARVEPGVAPRRGPAIIAVAIRDSAGETYAREYEDERE